jgi:hypothetical protein
VSIADNKGPHFVDFQLAFGIKTKIENSWNTLELPLKKITLNHSGAFIYRCHSDERVENFKISSGVLTHYSKDDIKILSSAVTHYSRDDIKILYSAVA